MSDDTPSVPSAADTSAAASPAPVETGSPAVVPFEPGDIKITTWVKGGTTTTRFDNDMKEQVAQADARRAESDRDRKIAATPIEQGGGLMFENNFAPMMETPRVLLRYEYPNGARIEILCELYIDDITEARSLNLVCPECVRRGVNSGFAQIKVDDSNRSWHLDTRTAGQIMHAMDDGRRIGYLSGGVITDTDVLRCPGLCGCAYRIDRNQLLRVK